MNNYNGSIANIPGTSIHVYSLLMAIAIIVVILTSWIKMYKRNIPTRTLEGSILLIVPLGLLGARIWYVLNNTSQINSFIDVFAVWNGGLAIEGGVTTGFIVGLFIFYRASKKYRISMWVYLDCILPNILLGQAIGRWGNFFNQEVLGANVGHPFSFLPNWINLHLHYPAPIDSVNGMVYRQPLFLYESICSLIGWFILSFVVPKIGSWFSKKPWKIEAEKFSPLWKKDPIIDKDYYQPWNLFKKLYQYHDWKKDCWKQAYYDFEPVASTIKNTRYQEFKQIKINPNMNFFQKNNIKIKNYFLKIFIKFKQDAIPLNNSYNPQHYNLTYAGVVGSSYFIFYGIIRVILEPFRDPHDIMTINGVSTSVVVSVLWVILGITLVIFAQWVARKKFRKKGWFYEKQY